MTSETISLLQAGLVRYFLAALILWRLNIVALHFVLMCFLKFNALSRWAPRYLVTSLLAMFSPLISIVETAHFLAD